MFGEGEEEEAMRSKIFDQLSFFCFLSSMFCLTIGEIFDIVIESAPSTIMLGFMCGILLFVGLMIDLSVEKKDRKQNKNPYKELRYCPYCGEKVKDVVVENIEVTYCKKCKVYYPKANEWIRVKKDDISTMGGK